MADAFVIAALGGGQRLTVFVIGEKLIGVLVDINNGDIVIVSLGNALDYGLTQLLLVNILRPDKRNKLTLFRVFNQMD